MKRFLFLFSVMVALFFGLLPKDGFAQACSVSSTFTSAGTGSTACFTKAGNQVSYNISNTFVGTVQLQYTQDNGQSYQIQDTFTASASGKTPQMSGDVRWRLFPSAYTSGTVTYVLLDLTTQFGKIKYSNIPIGPTAYASLGTSTACSATAEPITDIFVPSGGGGTFTGIGVLIGATVGTDPIIMILRDSQGALVASSATAGTAASGSASSFLEFAFTSLTSLAPGRYYVSAQCNGTTTTMRLIAASTYIDTTGSFLTSVFGTIPAVLAMPTTFTATKAPIVYLYR